MFHYSAAEAGQLQVVFECPTQPTNHSGWSVSIVDSNKTILSSYTVKSNQTIIADLPSSGDYYLVIKTAPLFLGRTFGIRGYYRKERPVVVYKYYDTQISFGLGGIGTGKLINHKGESFKKNKY